MDLLDIVIRLGTEAGVSGAPGMTTTAGQVGSLGRLVGWAKSAWKEIQTKHDDWDWMRSSNILGAGCSFTPASGQATSTLGTGAGTVGVALANFGKWDVETFRCYLASAGSPGLGGEMVIEYLPYDNWRDAYMLGAQRLVTTRPFVVAIGPNKSVCLGPPPNGLYTITADYWVAASDMVNDTDTPTGLPEAFHMAIVYKALMMYGAYESAAEVFQYGAKAYKELMAPLEAKYLPQIGFAGAL